MNKEFVPYAQALALKELGFDESCIATIDQTEYLHIKGTKNHPRGSMMYDTIDCPLYQQAFRWFREKYGFKSWIQEHTNDTFIYEIRPHVLSHYKEGEIYVYTTYEEAELACLKKLIEIVKNEKENILR
mgnify:CR=1 FL=1